MRRDFNQYFEDMFRSKGGIPMPRAELDGKGFIRTILGALFPPKDTMKGVDWEEGRPEPIRRGEGRGRGRRCRGRMR